MGFSGWKNYWGPLRLESENNFRHLKIKLIISAWANSRLLQFHFQYSTRSTLVIYMYLTYTNDSIYFWKNNPSFGIRWDTKIVLIGLNHWGHSKGDSRVRTMQNLLTNTTKTWRNVMLLFIKLKKLFKSASFRISPRSFEQHKLHVLILHCYFTQTISFKSFTANTIQTKGQRTLNIEHTSWIHAQIFVMLEWLHRCRWRMLKTKCVGDKIKMLVTVSAISVTNIHYLLTLAFGSNIQKMSPQA